MNNTTTPTIKEKTLLKPKFKFTDIIKMVIILIISQIVSVGVLLNPNGKITIEIITSLLMLGTLAICLIPFIRYEKINTEAKKITPKSMATISGIIILCLILNSIITALLSINSTENQELIEKLIQTNPISMGIQVVLFAPILEELIFRHYLLKDGKLLKLRIFIAIVGFALMHTITTKDIPTLLLETSAYIIPATGLTYIRLKYKSAKFSMIGHSIYNGIGFVVILVTTIMN